MTKKLFVAIALVLVCLLTACSGKTTQPATQQQPPQKTDKSSSADTLELSENDIANKTEQYFYGAGKTLKATYTNKNNYADEVVVPNAMLANLKILSKEKDGEYLNYECTADFSNADWNGTTSFKVSFTQNSPDHPPGFFVINGVEITEAVAEPSYPLDFSDENIYLLFEDKKFRYKANPEDKMMTLVDINKDTLQSVKMLEFVPDDIPDMHERYKVELHLTDGLVLRGTMFTFYWPMASKEEGKRQGIERWNSGTDDDDFVPVE